MRKTRKSAAHMSLHLTYNVKEPDNKTTGNTTTPRSQGVQCASLS